MAWNWKLINSAIVMFVLAWALGFVVHELLLGADYATTAGMRPQAEMQKMVYYIILAHALFAIAFAWVYAQGREDKPWLAQGVRYGIAIALLTVIPTYLIYHVVTPVPLLVAFKQIVFDTVRLVLMGIVLAWLNRSEARRPQGFVA
jgi:hypothetical protein